MTDQAVATFQQILRGRLVHLTDADYDAIRALYNGMIDKRPRLIARAVDAADVIAAVNSTPAAHSFRRRSPAPARSASSSIMKFTYAPSRLNGWTAFQ